MSGLNNNAGVTVEIDGQGPGDAAPDSLIGAAVLPNSFKDTNDMSSSNSANEADSAPGVNFYFGPPT